MPINQHVIMHGRPRKANKVHNCALNYAVRNYKLIYGLNGARFIGLLVHVKHFLSNFGGDQQIFFIAR